MDFIIYPPASGRKGQFTAPLERFYRRVDQNVQAFVKHHERKSHYFNNAHPLSRIYESLTFMRGASPKETYALLQDRVELISRQHNLVVPGSKQRPKQLILNMDYLVPKDLGTPAFTPEGMMVNPKKVKPMQLLMHSAPYLSLETYREGRHDYYLSLFAIDLPALGALIHHRQLTEEEVTSHNILTDVFYCDNAESLVRMGIFNRLADLVEGEFDNVDDWSSPYFQTNLYEELTRDVAADMVEHMQQQAGGSLSDFANNLPIPQFDLNTPRPLIEDFYISEMMWVNAVGDNHQYKMLKTLATELEHGFDFGKHDRRFKQMLSSRQQYTLTKHLGEHSELVEEYLKPLKDA